MRCVTLVFTDESAAARHRYDHKSLPRICDERLPLQGRTLDAPSPRVCARWALRSCTGARIAPLAAAAALASSTWWSSPNAQWMRNALYTGSCLQTQSAHRTHTRPHHRQPTKHSRTHNRGVGTLSVVEIRRSLARTSRARLRLVANAHEVMRIPNHHTPASATRPTG